MKLFTARCTGCRCKIGLFKSGGYPFRQAVYCTRICAGEPHAYATMEREDFWSLLMARGWTTGQVATRWGVAASVVSRGVTRRREPVS